MSKVRFVDQSSTLIKYPAVFAPKYSIYPSSPGVEFFHLINFPERTTFLLYVVHSNGLIGLHSNFRSRAVLSMSQLTTVAEQVPLHRRTSNMNRAAKPRLEQRRISPKRKCTNFHEFFLCSAHGKYFQK